MSITKLSKPVNCNLLLLTTACLTSLRPALAIAACRAIKGRVPDNTKYTWYIPLNPKRQSATFVVQVNNDFKLALVPDNNLTPPSPSYDKYLVRFGGSSNTNCQIGNKGLYNKGLMDANREVTLWLSWAGGVIAAGTGAVVGLNQIMSFIDPSPSPINYMLIGGYNALGNVTITYCYDFLVYDQMVPINSPNVTISGQLTVMDCGRQCDQDPLCVGYSVDRDVLPVDKAACNVFYYISGYQYDPQHVTYDYGNGTYRMTY